MARTLIEPPILLVHPPEERLFNGAKFNARILAECKRRGITLAHAADESGLIRQTFHRAARVKVSPTAEVYLRILRWLELSKRIEVHAPNG